MNILNEVSQSYIHLTTSKQMSMPYGISSEMSLLFRGNANIVGHANVAYICLLSFMLEEQLQDTYIIANVY